MACFVVSSLVVRLANQNLDSKLQQVTTGTSSTTSNGGSAGTGTGNANNNSHAHPAINGALSSNVANIAISMKALKQQQKQNLMHEMEIESDVDEFADTKELLPSHTMSNHHIALSARTNCANIGSSIIKDDMV